MSSATNEEIRAGAAEGKVRLPLAGLLALFTAGFLGIINETVPAGLLPEISKSLGRSESLAGQTITVYAVATALTAIPLNAALKNRGRRTLLVSALITFALANAVIALVDNFAVILIARFVAGVGAGLIWSNLGGYAARLVPEQFRGKAIAIAMAGIPVALSLGLPLGTLLGRAAGWQATFGVAAALSIVLVGWVFIALPNLEGMPTGGHVPVTAILRTRGVRTVVLVIAGYMIAHNILYTYIGPLAAASGAGGQIELVLLAFGVAALLSIWGTGAFVDPHHRRLMVTSTVLFGASAFVLAFATASPVILYVGVVAWGFAFGGSATLLLTAGMRAAGTDAIQSIIVTTFNISIAAGGVFGGLLLSGLGVTAIPWVTFALMIPTMITTVASRRHAFPHWPRG
jgi:predicted MFS family arabinose efflux permease